MHECTGFAATNWFALFLSSFQKLVDLNLKEGRKESGKTQAAFPVEKAALC